MQSVPVKRLAVLIHPHHLRAEEAIKKLDKAGKESGIEMIQLSSENEFFPENFCQAAVSIGGDGTLLAAVRFAFPRDIPVWGINVGHLGFLTTSGLDEIEFGIKSLARGEYSVERRAMIEADIRISAEQAIHTVALNDIVVHRDITSGQLALEAELDGRFLAIYEGDGLIAATPTGSTAYALSCGGPILFPAMSALLLTPICSHSLSARSLVFDDKSELCIKPKFLSPNAVVHVTADGQSAAKIVGPSDWHDIEIETQNIISIRRAAKTVGLVRFQDFVFSDVLRDKLGWAGTSPLRRTK